MAEIKISDLNPKGANLSVTDLLVISEDIGGGLYETKSITGDEVLNAVAKTAVAVRNQTGATIYKGTIVYISGTSGGKALISKAQADAEITSSKTLGVVTADIANNANGNVLTNGLLTDLDTRTTATHPFTADTLVIGDDLYLSPTNAGYVTNVKPIAPNNLVNIGKVLETSGTTGQILYAIVNGYELGELHDVDTTGAVTGNVLALDGSVWKPTTISSGITIGTTPITSGVAGRVLFEGAGNVMQEDSAFFWDNTNKRLGIGATPATNARLDIRAQGALSTDIAFRVRNSADIQNLFSLSGNGNFTIGLVGGYYIALNPSSPSLRGYNAGNVSWQLSPWSGENSWLTNDQSNQTKVGIGIINPTSKLHVYTAAADTSIKIGTGAGTVADETSCLKFTTTFAGTSLGQDALVIRARSKGTTSADQKCSAEFSLNRNGTNALRASITSQSNLLLQSPIEDTNDVGAIYLPNGTAPTASITDGYKQYSADIVAGNAAPHFRTENGSVIKLYKQDLPTSPTNAEIATLLSNLGLANLI